MTVRKVLSIRWIGFHLLTLGSIVLFFFLGKWQWGVGGTKHGSLRNYAYGVEWWVFAAILIVCWWRLLQQEISGAEKAAPKRPMPDMPRHRMPAPQVAAHVEDSEDPEMAEYNRYLELLHEKDLSGGAKRGRS
jgi:hypothetical protein